MNLVFRSLLVAFYLFVVIFAGVLLFAVGTIQPQIIATCLPATIGLSLFVGLAHYAGAAMAHNTKPSPLFTPATAQMCATLTLICLCFASMLLWRLGFSSDTFGESLLASAVMSYIFGTIGCIGYRSYERSRQVPSR